MVVLLPKAVQLVPLPAEGPHHPHPRQVFLGAGGQLALRLVRHQEAGGDFAVKQAGGQQGDGHKGDGHQGQPPVHDQHDPHVQHHHEHGAQHLHELVADEGADHLHVGGAPLDDVAGGVGGVPVEAQAQYVLVEAVPDGLHEALRAPGQVDAHSVDAQAPHRRRQGHRPRRDPQRAQGVGPQGVQVQQGPDPMGQVGLLHVQHAVHCYADDLGHHCVADGVQIGQDDGPGEKAQVSPQVAQDQGGFFAPGQLHFRFHRSPPFSRQEDAKKRPPKQRDAAKTAWNGRSAQARGAQMSLAVQLVMVVQ